MPVAPSDHLAMENGLFAIVIPKWSSGKTRFNYLQKRDFVEFTLQLRF